MCLHEASAYMRLVLTCSLSVLELHMYRLAIYHVLSPGMYGILIHFESISDTVHVYQPNGCSGPANCARETISHCGFSMEFKGGLPVL